MKGGAGTAAIDTDEAAAFLAASATFADLVESVAEDLWNRLWLGEWGVRALVGHTAPGSALETTGSAMAGGDGAALPRHPLGRPGGRFEPLFG